MRAPYILSSLSLSPSPSSDDIGEDRLKILGSDNDVLEGPSSTLLGESEASEPTNTVICGLLVTLYAMQQLPERLK